MSTDKGRMSIDKGRMSIDIGCKETVYETVELTKVGYPVGQVLLQLIIDVHAKITSFFTNSISDKKQ